MPYTGKPVICRLCSRREFPVRMCKAIDAQGDGLVFALYLERTAKDFGQRRMPYFQFGAMG
jgi:hypothetical protein